jgi:CheY-like chemotaxis protein
MVFHKAMLVDDDKTNQYLTYLVLQELQLAEQTVLFSDGKRALDYLLQHIHPRVAKGCPDLILLDLNMPMMDGFEFLERLTQLGQTALIQQSVVVLTTSENGEDYHEARRWQVKDYLVKPLTLEKMTEFIQRHYSLSGTGR